MALGSAALLGGALLLLFTTAILRSRLVEVEPTLLVRDRHGSFLAEVGAGEAVDEAGFWRVDALPERVVAATLAAEDRRFRAHPGVDPLAIARALRQNVVEGHRVSGASTIAMQVARMQDPGARGWTRKAVEATTALFLTARHGRDDVLRQYLTLAPYGNRIHGIAYAARRYFDKPVDDLSWAETAFLAALPQAPGRMNPFDPEGRKAAAARGRRILAELLRVGIVSNDEYELAAREIARLRVPVLERRPEDALHAALHVAELLRAERGSDALRRQPLVESTLDLEIQHRVALRALQAAEGWRASGAGNVAVLVVERATGNVLAHVGSADWFDVEHAGAIDYARTPRSPGSTLKPFLYAMALDRGVTGPSTILEDLRRGPGDMENSDDRFLGPLLPRVALANSRNVPAALLLQRLGLERGRAFLGDLGLGTRDQGETGLGLAIGEMPVTLAQLVGAATALADDGRLHALRWHEGQVLPEPRRVLSEDTARIVTMWLADPLARLPSFPRMGALEYPFPVAVKTGTSSGWRDAWAIAWSSDYVVGAWIGDADCRPMKELTGYRSAARLVRQVMMGLHREDDPGTAREGFPPPRAAEAVRTCALSGDRATDACDSVFLEWFPAGTAPAAQCSVHLRVAVDRRDGSLATRATPRSERELRTFVDLPPRQAEWGAVNGLVRPPSAKSGGRSATAARERVRLLVASPPDGSSLTPDPEMPRGLDTVELAAIVDPQVPQVVWYVDGEPFQVVEHPYRTRWPMAPGSHSFEVRVPFGTEVSRAVHVRVGG